MIETQYYINNIRYFLISSPLIDFSIFKCGSGYELSTL